jgi:hypothetical protein
MDSRPGRGFCLRHRGQIGCGAHPTSDRMGIVSSFPAVKHPDREANHTSNAKVMNECTYTSTLPYIFMAWCLINTGKTLSYIYVISNNTSIICDLTCFIVVLFNDIFHLPGLYSIE